MIWCANEPMTDNFYIAIMAGGIGSRFWPASRTSLPKQFLDITGTGQSLLQMTVSRLSGLVPYENILIVSNQMYKDLILEQLPEMDPSQLLLEPVRNNTAPCVAYTALHLQAKEKSAVFAILPSDHMIRDEDAFRQSLQKAFIKASEDDAIVTLGIRPDRPDTGYGYVKYDLANDRAGIHKVKEFVEKPDLDLARQYLDSGDYLWNAGMFIWSVKTILKSFEKHAPDILDILGSDLSKFGTEEESDYITSVYKNTRNISVDYAILERADNIHTIPVDIGWSDLGTWNSLYSYLDKSPTGNIVDAAESKLVETNDSFIRISNQQKLVQ